MRIFHLWDVIVVGSVIVVACTPADASPSVMMDATPIPAAMQSIEAPSADAMQASKTPTSGGVMDGSPTSAESAMMEGTAVLTPLPEWMGISLSNVATGQPFRLSDFHGKIILLEPMAVWCTKCRALQQEILKVRQELRNQASELVVVSVDVDPNEDEQYLKAYVEQTGLDWSFAVAPSDLARALADSYGDQFLNPPSTPLLLIDRDGIARALPFGPKTAADLLAALRPLLDGGM